MKGIDTHGHLNLVEWITDPPDQLLLLGPTDITHQVTQSQCCSSFNLITSQVDTETRLEVIHVDYQQEVGFLVDINGWPFPHTPLPSRLCGNVPAIQGFHHSDTRSSDFIPASIVRPPTLHWELHPQGRTFNVGLDVSLNSIGNLNLPSVNTPSTML